MKRNLAALLLLALLAACTAQKQDRKADIPADAPDVLAPYREHKALLFEGMGSHGREIKTRSDEAQKYFNQGLALCYGFNHDEAIRSYAEAAKLDPDCAMAYWGMAYAMGPNFNLPMDEDHAKLAYASIQQAIKRKENASATERELIDAMATRYSNPPAADHAPLAKAYSQAMGKLWQKYPKDQDIGFIYAESLLNRHPWDQWTRDGKPKEDTLKVMEVLEAVLKLNINHVGANHMYIHTVEGSQNPEKGVAAAERLGALAPGIGHIVHMPAHIYMRMGRYRDSALCNAKASQCDRDYFAKVGDQGIYHIYHVHNDHFLVWTAMFEGRYEDAIKAADDMIAHMPEFFKAFPDVASFLVTKLEVYVRFGKWEEILKYPQPREDQPYAIAMWHYARGIALANTQKIEDARAEAAMFEEFAAKVPASHLINGVVPASEVLNIARQMLAGETAFKAGETDKAFVSLRAAVEAESAMRYTEPNPWMVPTRHALGALLLQQGKHKEAEDCYLADLKWYPENGWSLHGLAECQQARGAEHEAHMTQMRFEKAWKLATVEIHGSCFCRTH